MVGWHHQLNRHAAAAKSLQSCLTLCDPVDGSPPGSPVPGILQARTLEWVAISFSTLCTRKQTNKQKTGLKPNLVSLTSVLSSYSNPVDAVLNSIKKTILRTKYT